MPTFKTPVFGFLDPFSNEIVNAISDTNDTYTGEMKKEFYRKKEAPGTKNKYQYKRFLYVTCENRPLDIEKLNIRWEEVNE